MSKTFVYKMKRDPEELLPIVKKKAKENGVDFKGDEKNGRVSGKGVKGSYSVSDNQLRITVDKKPFIVSWGFIEKKLNKAADEWLS